MILGRMYVLCHLLGSFGRATDLKHAIQVLPVDHTCIIYSGKHDAKYRTYDNYENVRKNK